MRSTWVVTGIVAAATFALMLTVRNYPASLALLTAMAIGALTYSAQRTFQNMRHLFGEPGEKARPRERSRAEIRPR